MSTFELSTEHANGDRRHETRLASLANALFLTRLVCSAFWRLLFYDVLCWMGFAKTYQFVRRCRQSRSSPKPDIIERVVWAGEEACVWYFKRTYCLQRSAVCAWMLRRRGVAAELVIGFRPVPIDSHAWVEVDGKIVNDRPQYQKFFRVLDRL